MHHGAAFLEVAHREQVARADREHHQRGGEIGGSEHVGEAVGEARIEDDREPVERVGDAVAHLMSGRRLHPAVGGEDPERRDRGADRHRDRREHVQPGRHALPAEQHHAEEGRLEEERHQHLVADERADHVAHHDREAAPIGPELVAEHDAGHDAHGEGDGEDLGPEPGQAVQVLASGGDPAHQQRRDECGEPDGEARKDDMKDHREGELQSRQQDGIQVHRSFSSERRSRIEPRFTPSWPQCATSPRHAKRKSHGCPACAGCIVAAIRHK